MRKLPRGLISFLPPRPRSTTALGLISRANTRQSSCLDTLRHLWKSPPMNSARLFPLTFSRLSARKGRMSWGRRCQSGMDQGLSLSSKRSKAEFQRFDAPNMQHLGPFKQLNISNQQLTGSFKLLNAPNQQLTGSFKLLNAPNQQLTGSFKQLNAPNQQLTGSFKQLNAPNQQLIGSFKQLNAPNQQLTGSFKQLNASNQQLTGSFKLLNAPNQQLIYPAMRRFAAFGHESDLIRLTTAAAKLWLGRTGLFPAAPQGSINPKQHACRTFPVLTGSFLGRFWFLGRVRKLRKNRFS